VRAVDCVGYIASFLVLLTFYMKEMVPLRAAALCSNVAFLVYGGLLHLAPIAREQHRVLARQLAALGAASERFEKLYGRPGAAVTNGNAGAADCSDSTGRASLCDDRCPARWAPASWPVRIA